MRRRKEREKERASCGEFSGDAVTPATAKTATTNATTATTVTRAIEFSQKQQQQRLLNEASV